ncbi:MAG: pyridoxamine 5'-phosphate oxidase family protein, partial [Raoultibacter sp.]
KLEAIGRDDHVSFCVIDHDHIVPEKFTTEFRSVIAFGIARVVADDDEKRHGLELIAEKYSQGHDSASEIENGWNHTCVVAFDIDYFSTKEAIELVRARDGRGEPSEA